MRLPRMLAPWLMVTLSTASGVAFLACGSDSPAEFTTPDASTPVADTDSGSTAPKPECTASQEGTQRACTCVGGKGSTQTCRSGAYDACKCDAPAGPQLCKAGFYSGEFSGKYKPGAFGLGIFPSPLEVDIIGVGANGYPALSFTLEETKEGSGEFQSYRIKNGCMVGSANAYGTNNPFIGRIDGELDCTTGIVTATISGQYNLLSLGLMFQFTGPATGQFTLPASRLTDGVWSVQEPNALIGQPAGGGGGKWSAFWTDTAAPSGEDPCTAGWSDAGVGDAGADAADAH
jgi:hypothetical protein